MAERLVVLDLDGVVRHFDSEQFSAVERARGLEAGVVTRTAFEPSLLDRLVTGHLRRTEWVDLVGQRIGDVAAARECFAAVGSVDWHVLAIVDRLRHAGETVVILTNGTDTIEAELRELGVWDRFDAVFSTWDIGFAKPDRRAFQRVVDAVGVDPAATFFADDSASKLTGAAELGMSVHHFRSAAGLEAALAAFLTL